MKDFYEAQSALAVKPNKIEEFYSNPNYFAQEKFDGCRYLIHKGLDGSVKIYSKHTSVKTNTFTDKTGQLLHLADFVTQWMPPGTVLDGEVTAPPNLQKAFGEDKSRSSVVTHITGALEEKARFIQLLHGHLEYEVFDLLAYKGEELLNQPYEDRFEKLFDLDFGLYMHLARLESGVNKKILYEEVVASGGEGIILKDMRSPYLEGQRKKAWIKVKKDREYDVVFMGVKWAEEESIKKGDLTPTRTRIAGQIGSIIYGQYRNGKLVELGNVSGLNDAERLHITNHWQELIGSVFTLRAYERSIHGALELPRFIRWRDDKPAEECKWDLNEA